MGFYNWNQKHKMGLENTSGSYIFHAQWHFSRKLTHFSCPVSVICLDSGEAVFEHAQIKRSYVRGQSVLQFRNNWMKKVPKTVKIGWGRTPSPIWLSEGFFKIQLIPNWISISWSMLSSHICCVLDCQNYLKISTLSKLRSNLDTLENDSAYT